jgi:proteic killer suppression protein
VILSFKDRKLADLCNDDRQLQKSYGVKGRKKIRSRLDDLDAAGTLALMATLPGARCEELKGDRAGKFSVRVHDGYRIIFTPDHDPVPVKPDGGVSWTAVTAIEIHSIEDYHD